MSADNVEATEDPLQNLQSRKVDENEDDDGAVVDYRRMLGYLLSPLHSNSVSGRARKMHTKYQRGEKKTLNQMVHENSKISFKKHGMLCTKLCLQILDCTFLVEPSLIEGNKERHVVCG